MLWLEGQEGRMQDYGFRKERILLSFLLVGRAASKELVLAAAVAAEAEAPSLEWISAFPT